MKLINIEINENAKGKNIEALKKSRKIRQDFKQLFDGVVPSSILTCDRAKGRRVYDPIRESRSIGKIKEDNKEEILQRTKSRDIAYKTAFYCSKTVDKNGKKPISIFPQDVGKKIVNLYCPKGGTVYDPFAGHVSRMQLVWETGRNYIGVDICHEYMEFNKRVKKGLEEKNKLVLIKNPARITLIESSSDYVPSIPDEYADFTITSPPYWDTEYYGPEPEQLGTAKSYDGFLKALEPHIEENYRILKHGSFCCWFINDIRKNKIFIPYHADLFYLFRDCGFEPFNIYIVDLGEPLGTIFVQEIIRTKILPKRHEYILVFKKP